jgi:hypothetical protein
VIKQLCIYTGLFFSLLPLLLSLFLLYHLIPFKLFFFESLLFSLTSSPPFFYVLCIFLSSLSRFHPSSSLSRNSLSVFFLLSLLSLILLLTDSPFPSFLCHFNIIPPPPPPPRVFSLRPLNYPLFFSLRSLSFPSPSLSHLSLSSPYLPPCVCALLFFVICKVKL